MLKERMNKIAVCVITFQRIDGLRKLLLSLTETTSTADSTRSPSVVDIFVIDNDPKGSAEALCKHFEKNVIYLHEPQQGIPFARNAALEATINNYDYLCFIDDDEWPSSQWLASLTTTIETSRADAVMGPVVPVYPENCPQWIIKGSFFERTRRKTGERMDRGASNNVMLRADFLRRTGLRFNETLRFTGGSDTYFFQAAIAEKIHIVWCNEAEVFEDIPRHRMTVKWLIQRSFRAGNTLSLCDQLRDPSLKTKVIRLFKGGGRCILVLLALPFALFFGQIRLIKLVLAGVKGLGSLAGMIGFRYEEYAPKRLHKNT